ncbi:hypothetical protein M5X02_30150 [Paenibacillus alvei]|uniref:hypothetical protein n=1 Tax=Paenibacillus alvei TaxID=44250 RepID=UPI000289B397|nr:hypothetical protein [Paenibacillus alvei]EJW14055.1 hypothetical protein PAV_141p01610 [Paenibacillus alvei DSM 29]MCY9544892.1 hypothetical protein [Paenibacillus alvei]MCY9707793.1 hypothetical protein [Paenibacillus alvei]MEC0082695.1 hypothetical protein [Paenibacillus alvei]
MKTVQTLVNVKKDTKAGNHRVSISQGKRDFYYYATAICKVDDTKGTFVIDSSYGTQSTTRACNAYRKHFVGIGYREAN